MTNVYSYLATRAYTSNRQKLIGLLLVGLLITLGVYYLMLTNSIVAQGYEINDLSSKVRQLKTTTQKLQADATERQSLTALQTNVLTNKFVAVNTIQYLNTASTQKGVAIK